LELGLTAITFAACSHWGKIHKKLGGLAEMAFQLGLTLIIILMMFQQPVKNTSDAIRTYVQSKECKRKIILNYFDHKVSDKLSTSRSHML